MFWTCLETVMTVDTIPHPGKNYNYASETLSPYSKIKTSFQCPPDLELKTITKFAKIIAKFQNDYKISLQTKPKHERGEEEGQRQLGESQG